jgi:hypothetical protein
MNEQRPSQSPTYPPNYPPKDQSSASWKDLTDREHEDSPGADPYEKPCPEPKACPTIPEKPCPPSESDPYEQREKVPEPTQTGACGTNAPSASTPTTPAQQLEKLRKDLENGQRELQKFEPLKTALADLGQRIQTLERAVEGQSAATTAYTEFYRAIERYRSEVECSIPTVRCQLELTEKQKNCIRKAIATVDARVKQAQSDRDAQSAEVQRREGNQKRLEANLEWAKKWYEFFTTAMQQQVAKTRDDLKALQALADPSKDQCEVWFYLSEMEAMLRSARTTEEGEACYMEALNLATFLDCWSPKCYAAAQQHWIVAFNEADSAEKAGKSELAVAVSHAAELDRLAKDAEAKRREWILKELKAQDCCGPLSKCP